MPLLIFSSYCAVFVKTSSASGFTESKKTRQWQLWGLGRSQALTPVRGCGSVWQVTIKGRLYEEGAVETPSQLHGFVSFSNLKRVKLYWLEPVGKWITELMYKEIQSGDGANSHQDSLLGCPQHQLNKANRQTSTQRANFFMGQKWHCGWGIQGQLIPQ